MLPTQEPVHLPLEILLVSDFSSDRILLCAQTKRQHGNWLIVTSERTLCFYVLVKKLLEHFKTLNLEPETGQPEECLIAWIYKMHIEV